MNEIFRLFDDTSYQEIIKSINNLNLRTLKWLANYYPDARIRKLCFCRLGVSMGEGTYANLGMRITVNEICNENPKIIIGDKVSIAPNVCFVADSSANNGDEINSIPYVTEKLTKNGKIIIDDEVWIGANVTILPNVIIGRCSVIGAGSVVNKNIEPYTVYAGVPAKKIRDLR